MRTIMLLLLLSATGCSVVRHHPTVWEMHVQKVAHDGDTTGLLWDMMKQYDSIMTVKCDDPEDSKIDTNSFIHFMEQYESRLNYSQVHSITSEMRKWASNMYGFVWDYYGTSVGWPCTRSRDIYYVPVSWWKRPHAKERL